MSHTFTITQRDIKTNARRGVLRTAHGIVHTPSYVMVATHGSIKTLKPSDMKKTKTQIVIANTYHLWNEALKSKNILAKRLGTRLPTMTDSGGFQLFSFGAAREHNVGKVLKRRRRQPGEKSVVKITEKGVFFTENGKKKLLTPELSIKIQERIGADIMFVLDECTSPLHSQIHNKKALQRTTRWAIRCLKVKSKKLQDQVLFGIVQGGRFDTLRTASAKAIGALPFDGFGIGGSFGEKEMAQSLKAVTPYLPDTKPRHLLGIGKIKDIFIAVENGIDLFDCVIPTREARHGRLYTDAGILDIRKTRYGKDRRRLYGSRGTFAHLHKLFRDHNPKAGRLATIHNIYFFPIRQK